MHRLFVALTLPDAVNDALIGRMGGIEGTRWQNAEQLHITLRFLGQRDGRAAEAIAQLVEGFTGSGPTLHYTHYGQFDSGGRLDSLWVGLAPREPIAALKQKMDSALRRVGVGPDERRYLPHVTVARFGRAGGSAQLGSWLAEAPPLPAEPFRARQLVLFESRLGRGGAHYEPIVRRPLG